MRLTKLLFILCLLLAVTYFLPAQNPFIIQYTSFDGLPSNNVYQVYQDSQKFIWFATDAGVARYDGSRFTYFSKQNGLNSNDVVKIKEDLKGRIWFFNMDATLNFYQDGTIYNCMNAPFLDSLMTIELFRNFFEDSDHTLYFYHNHQREIYTLDSLNKVRKYKFPSVIARIPDNDRFIESMDIRHIQRASDGTIYMWTIAGLYRFNSFPDDYVLVPDLINYKAVFAENPKSRFIVIRGEGDFKYDIWKLKDDIHLDRSNPPIGTNSEFVSSVIEDVNGRVWISTYDQGVFCYEKNHLKRHFDVTDAQSLFQDHEQNIWFSSLKDGVFKINPCLNKHIHYENSLFEDKEILEIAPHIRNGVWITNGNKIYLLQDGIISTLNFQSEQNNLNQLLHLDENTLIAGALSTPHYAIEGLRYNRSKYQVEYSGIQVSPRSLKKMTQSKSGSEIVSWNFFSVVRIGPDLFNTARYLDLGERVYNVFYDVDDRIIVNTRNIFELHGDSLVHSTSFSLFDKKIITDHIIIEDTFNVFNIEGDSIFLQSGNQFYNLTASWDYPVDLHINHIEYQHPVLYMATSRNVYYCDYPLRITQGEPIELQMLDIRFRNINDILFRDDNLYIASDDGLTIFLADSLKNGTVFPPTPYFQSIEINGTEQLSKSHQIILTGRNKIILAFGSINLTSSPAMYSYMLEGLDKEWQDARSTNVVYESLSRGDYVFKLRTRKPTSDWSQTIEYKILVKATLWEQPLFYIILSVILAGIVIVLIIWRKNIQIKRQDIEHQLVLLEQRALQAMMNPHFIFNSLGSIQSYLLQNKPSEASQYLSQFARLIRQNLNASNTAMIKLQEEINRLKNYLDLEQMRMEKKFDYFIKVDDAINPQFIMIPSMVIQPFVENSIWHGIHNIPHQGEIQISFKMNDNKSVRIIVTDNGSGIKRNGNEGMNRGNHLAKGMAMTRKRLELLGRKYKLTTSVEINDANPGDPFPGTRVEIIVPFANIG